MQEPTVMKKDIGEDWVSNLRLECPIVDSLWLICGSFRPNFWVDTDPIIR